MDIIRYELVEQVLAAGKENPTIVKTLVVIGGLLIWSKLPKSSKIPGPPTIPLIGNYQMIAHSFSRTVNEYFIKLNNQYGPLVELKQMTLTNYVVADAYEVKRILTDTTTFSRSELFQQIGSGLFHHALFVLPSGEQWKRHRKLIQPAFGPTHLRHAALVSVETMGELITTLDAMFTDSDTVKVNMHGALTATALDVVGKVAFGESLHSVERFSSGGDTTWNDLETMTTNVVPLRFVLPQALWSAVGVATHSPKIAAAKANVLNYLGALAIKRKEMIQNNTLNQSGYEMDVLHRLLLSNSQNSLTDEEVMGEIVGFFIAGHETTSNTLTSCMYDLAGNPDVCEKLYNEIKDVNLDTSSNIIEDISKLPYLENVLKESQRLHTVVPLTNRVSTKPVTVLGHDLPANTIFVVNMGGIHMNEKYHPNPETYNPDRFNEPMIPGSFLPFGDGPHNCIGQKMAMIESKIILIKLIQNYKFSLIEGEPVKYVFSVTYGLKEGFNLQVQRR